MQMLSVGGVDLGERAEWPYFEDRRATLEAGGDWVEEYHGKAVKVLDPLRYRLAPGHEYRAVWLSRNPREQARSWVKFHTQRQKLPPPTKQRVKETVRKMREGAARAQAYLSQLCEGRVLRLRFEDLIDHPVDVAKSLAEFLEMDLDVEHMVAAVRQRPTGSKCAPIMLEPILSRMGPVPHPSGAIDG